MALEVITVLTFISDVSEIPKVPRTSNFASGFVVPIPILEVVVNPVALATNPSVVMATTA